MALGFEGYRRLNKPVDLVESFRKGRSLRNEVGFNRSLRKIADDNVSTNEQKLDALTNASLRSGQGELGYKLLTLAKDREQKKAQRLQEQRKSKLNDFKSTLSIAKEFGGEPGFKAALQKFQSSLDESDPLYSFLGELKDIDTESNSILLNRRVTESDLAQYPVLRDQGVAVGEEIEVPLDMDTGQIKGDLKRKSFSNESLSEDIQKQVLKLQANGGRIATAEDLSSLPEQAFQKIGIGENAVTVVKAPNQLSPEQGTKFEVARKARDEAQSLLKDIEKAGFLERNLAGTALGGKKFSQDLAKKADFVREGLARALSGAAVPETEQKRFQEIFTISPFDKKEKIEYKLKRVVELVDNLETSVLYGAEPSRREINNLLASEEEQIKSKNSSNSGAKNLNDVITVGQFKVRAK